MIYNSSSARREKERIEEEETKNGDDGTKRLALRAMNKRRIFSLGTGFRYVTANLKLSKKCHF